MVAGLRASPKLKLQYDAPPQEDDTSAQIGLFEHYRQSGAGGAILAPTLLQPFQGPIEEATAKGMPIVLLDEDVEIHNTNVALVLNDDRYGGMLAAQAVGEILKGKGTVGVIGVDPNRASNLERERAFEEELGKTFPKIAIVAHSIGTLNLAQEQSSASEVLSSFGDIDALVALTATSTRGAYYAVLNHHRQTKIHIIGFDQGLLVPVKKGGIDAVVVQRSHSIGKAAAEAIANRLEGKQWSSRTVIRPFLLTADSFNSPLATQELDAAWWDDHDE